MNRRRSATVTAVLCGMGGVAWFAGFGSAGIENTAAPTLERLAPFHTADLKRMDASQLAALGDAGLGNAEVKSVAEPVRGMPTDMPAVSDEPKSIAESVLTNSSEMMPSETPPLQVATAGTPTMPGVAVISVETECLESCIDRYLWALYQRTPKEDTIKVQEPRKVTIKKKRKTLTVTKSFARR